MSVIVKTCPFCDKTTEVKVTEEQLNEMNLPNKERRNIQEIFPDKTADEREAIKTGICTPCWNEVMGD